MFRAVLPFLRRVRADRGIPLRARAEARRDRERGLGEDPGCERAIASSVDWLCEAHDRSASADGGVARHFSLVSGWAPSYPETTGYIVPTLLACADHLRLPQLRDRARRMTDWLVRIQLPDGGFQGGVIGQRPVVPVAFNTGQILMAIAAAVGAFGEHYRDSLRRAGDWLVRTQDADGAWRRHPSPFAIPGETYATHAAWGLLEAERVEPGRGYGDAALRNVRWALSRQRANGWFEACCLTDGTRPLTHTIGYALRGVLEAHRFSGDAIFLDAGVRAADGILSALERDGRLCGRLDANWRGATESVCLTGSVQIAACWFLLYAQTGDPRYRDAARAVNRFVRRTVSVEGPPETRGGVKGSFPVDGTYCKYEYLSWGTKFFIDSNLVELAGGQSTSR